MAKEIEEFVIGFKRQKVWGWPIATALFAAGTGSGLFLVSLWLESQTGNNFNAGIILGLIVGGIATSAAFVFDLGRKERFWRVMLRPGKSWLSRGIILIMVMVIFGALYIAPQWLGWLPWSKGDGIGRTLQIVSAIAALGVMMYSGFLLSYSSSIPFWNTPLLPVLFVVYSFMGGVGSIFALNLALGGTGVNFKSLEMIEISLITASFILIFVYILTMLYSTMAAKQAASILLKGKLALPFIGGVIVLGLVIPALIILLTYSGTVGTSAASAVLVVAGICELTGGWLLRYSLLRVGVQNKLM